MMPLMTWPAVLTSVLVLALYELPRLALHAFGPSLDQDCTWALAQLAAPVGSLTHTAELGFNPLWVLNPTLMGVCAVAAQLF